MLISSLSSLSDKRFSLRLKVHYSLQSVNPEYPTHLTTLDRPQGGDGGYQKRL